MTAKTKLAEKLFLCARVSFACAGLCGLAFAQTMRPDGSNGDAVVTDSSGGIVQDADKPLQNLVHFPRWISLDGQYRGRFERDTALKYVPGASDTYYLERMRLKMTLRPTDWLRLAAELQDSRNFFYGNRARPANSSDPIDLRQAYVELGKAEGPGFKAKVGRQEVVLGSGRLIAYCDWLNTAHSHDLARASYTSTGSAFSVDAMGGSEVLINPNGFDQHVPGEHWYGLYTTAKKLIPGASLEPYYLVKTDVNAKGELGSGSAALSAPGIRLIGKLDAGLDYSTEVVKEFGHYGSDRINALAGAYVLGWTIAPISWKPRLSFEYDHASGDHNSKDGERQTFDTFYTGHAYYGFADQVGWKNIRSARGGFDFAATKKITLRFDVLDDYLASTQDGLYTSGGVLSVLNRKATSGHVGVETDALVDFKLSKQTDFKAGYSRIFPGEFLTQSTKGASFSSPFVMWTKAF